MLSERPSLKLRHDSHVLQASAPSGCRQLIALAKMRAQVVLPTPRGPQKRYNPSTTRPSSYYTSGTKYTAGDFFYQKAWFIRLQNISLGYTLPKSILTKSKILNNVRFHASVNNVFVITPYNGLDPETDAYAAAYPNARTFSFGVDVSF